MILLNYAKWMVIVALVSFILGNWWIIRDSKKYANVDGHLGMFVLLTFVDLILLFVGAVLAILHFVLK